MLLARALRTISRTRTKITAASSTMATAAAAAAATSVKDAPTPFHIHITPDNTGILKFAHDDGDAAKVSELLQKDLENHHVYFNSSGFHNHIVHHLLALYGTGAAADLIQKGFDHNNGYQRKAMSPRDQVVDELEQDWAGASKYLGQGNNYANFLKFFQSEIAKKGWQDVLKEYLFREDDRARDLFARLYAGFLHPMIQLLYGIEFAQPAIIAEALAQTAVHENRLGAFLTRAQEAADKRGPEMGAIVDLFEAVRKTGKLASSAAWKDPNRIYDGVMVRAPDEAVEFLSQVKVREDELEERTAEMFHASAYVAATAAFHPPNIPKYDFFLIHHLNASPIFLTINKQPWIPTAMKVRLLEWKIRLDIIQYVARGCPPLQPDLLRNYTPKDRDLVSRPEGLLARFHPIPDDGHTIKVVRALLIAQQISRDYADRPWIRMTDDEMWLKAQYMLLDGNEHVDPKWVRSAGFEEAWKEIPKAE